MEMLLDPALDVAERAAGNFAANTDALRRSQPDLTFPPRPDFTWLFARDGSLTAMLDGNRWWGNCSVPLAAARFMLRSMDIRGTLGCFLSPMHAAQLRVALDRLHARQGVLAIVPELETLAVLLHAYDFARDIAAGRLWFAAGPQWEAELHGIFDRNPGLPTPAEFIRPILADSSPADSLIGPAQTIFAEAGARRGERLRSIVSRWPSRPARPWRMCLLAGSEFRLWDDAALVLAGLRWDHVGLEADRVDSDQPTSAAPLALARAAVNCDAVVSANCFRRDLPGVTPLEQPWVTWVTAPRVPAATDAGPNDRLILAHPNFSDIAKASGWDDARLQIAAWPPLTSGSPAGEFVSLIADTHPLAPPKSIGEYSSKVLLWNTIRDELLDDPFAAIADVASYLQSRRSRLQIGDAGFDAVLFAEQLIAPAVHQGLAACLIREGLPVRLFGRGWDQIDRFAPYHGGPIRSRDELAAALSRSAAVVHAWPWDRAHPVESLGCGIVRGTTARDLLRSAQTPAPAAIRPGAPTLVPETIRKALVR